MDKSSFFEEQMSRIRLVTGLRTNADAAKFLGIPRSSLSDAKRRGKIPSAWLIILLRARDVHPEWVLTGKGPCFICRSPESGCCETGEAFAERKTDEQALRRLSTRALADELVRRIAVSQEKSLCSPADA